MRRTRHRISMAHVLAQKRPPNTWWISRSYCLWFLLDKGKLTCSQILASSWHMCHRSGKNSALENRDQLVWSSWFCWRTCRWSWISCRRYWSSRWKKSWCREPDKWHFRRMEPAYTNPVDFWNSLFLENIHNSGVKSLRKNHCVFRLLFRRRNFYNFHFEKM